MYLTHKQIKELRKRVASLELDNALEFYLCQVIDHYTKLREVLAKFDASGEWLTLPPNCEALVAEARRCRELEEPKQ